MDESRVFVAGGSTVEPLNYHSNVRCKGLSHAAKIRPRALATLTGVARCSLCWSDLRGWELVAHDTERDGDSLFEVEFVRQVLSRVRQLEPHDVTPQGTVKLDDGSTLRIDFVLHRSGLAPLAIELDGYNKTGRVEDAASVARDDKAKRRQLEQQRNYEVVAFANKDLSDPHAAIRDIEARLERREHRVPMVADISVPESAWAEREATAQPSGRPRRRWTLLVAASVLIAAGVAWLLFSVLDDGAPSHAPTSDGSCPAEAQVKGNVSDTGEHIFHEPGWRYYDATTAEECFESADDALKAGYRPSQAQ